MKKAGHSLSDIAWQLDLKNGSEVSTLLKMEFEENAQYITSDTRALLLALEWERLEGIIKAHYLSAEAGDIGSAKIILDAIKLQISIGQLSTPDSQADQHRILVISGKEQDYIEKLKEMAE